MKQEKPKNSEKKQQKEVFLENLCNLCKLRERVPKAFDSTIFQ